MVKYVTHNGTVYKITKSPRPTKQARVININTGKTVDFGDPNLREYPGTKRGDAYCTRSLGITDKQGNKTGNDPRSANFWSRKLLWNCKDTRSLSKPVLKIRKQKK